MIDTEVGWMYIYMLIWSETGDANGDEDGLLQRWP